jgi:4-hydroxy-tetrahydrodipicolinate synthase
MTPETGRPGRWRGAWTALVTPFDADGRVDEEALRRLVRWQIDSGVHGLVPCGTTGEGATLTPEEQERVVTVVVQEARGRVGVLAGCGTNDTRRTIEAATRVSGAGADALLVVTPYYNKPNRSGMLAHYRAVCEATAKPVVVYNVPGRTGQNLGSDLALELASVPGVIGIKEASGNLEQIATILAGRQPGFAIFSGDDSLALPTIAMGADGLISVVSNEAPEQTADLVTAALEGRMAEARKLHFQLLPLMRANFIETSPVPVKVAMALIGRCAETVRAPLGPAAPETRAALALALDRAGIDRLRT